MSPLFAINSTKASAAAFTQKTSAGSASTLHADFNSDGREDFVYTTFNGAGFAVQLSTGDGVYGPPAVYTLPDGYAAAAIAIGDFDQDGRADLAVFGSLGASPYVAYVYINQGNGTFALKSTFTTDPLGAILADAIAGDFNHDGKMDVAYVQYPYLTVLFGDGQGGFNQGPRTQVQNTGNLMLGDFDAMAVPISLSATTSTTPVFKFSTGTAPVISPTRSSSICPRATRSQLPRM